jgi:FixJ family two-component response regulator
VSRKIAGLICVNPIDETRGRRKSFGAMSKDTQMLDAPQTKVAIVDDDPSVRDSLQFLIEILGYPVETFGSAADFLRAGVSRFSRVILDHHMPRMTGLDLAEFLQNSNVPIPIMLITGSLTPDMIARANQFGIGHVLEKPPTEKQIIDFIAGDRS